MTAITIPAGAESAKTGTEQDDPAAKHRKWAALLEHMISDCDRMAESQSAVRLSPLSPQCTSVIIDVHPLLLHDYLECRQSSSV